MYDRIFVPLDGSQLAEQVLPYVTRISLGMGIPIHLMQVIPTVSEALADPVHGRYQSGISAGAHDEAIDYLNSVKRNMAGVEITCDAHEGDVVSHIIEEADRSPSSLVAMSTHGRSGVTRWLMGSVTDNVLHHTKNPMLIYRTHQEGDPEPDTNLETIIVPLDGSPLAEQVLPHVTALARAMNLKVTLVRAAATAEVPRSHRFPTDRRPLWASFSEFRSDDPSGGKPSGGLYQGTRGLPAETGGRFSGPPDSARFRSPCNRGCGIGNTGQLGGDDYPWTFRTRPVDVGQCDRPGCAAFGRPGVGGQNQLIFGLADTA